ncbi:MAG: hypothetical protein PHP44_11310 [Kiritimatiellae bacterium]|nr:hypothetical protein [Kiritimatiellia bacterium]
MKTRSFQAYRELRALINTLEKQYAGALHLGEKHDLIEACGGLCIAYSASGNGPLAKKWAEQYLFHLAECTGGGFFSSNVHDQPPVDPTD